MRIPLALQLIQLLEPEDYREFWAVFTKLNNERFAALLLRLNDRLKHWHTQGIYHDPTVQLLSDALTWGAGHPAELLERGAHALDSPNVVAFTLIIDEFHRINEATGACVTTFIHDEQNQFAKYLKQSYELLKGFAFEPSWISPIPDLKKMPTFACEMRIADSASCIGLQLIDVALWIVKRDMLGSDPLRGKCKLLSEFILNNGRISPFTRASMIMEAEGLLNATYALPMDEEKLAEGKRLLGEFESARLAKMNEVSKV